MITEITDLIESCTDELLAIMVVGGYMASHFVGVIIPAEAPLIVLGYYFVRKNIEVNIK